MTILLAATALLSSAAFAAPGQEVVAGDGLQAPEETRALTARSEDSSGAALSRRPVDYTAWTLAPGEVRLGLTRLDVGLLPGVELGTQTGLDVLGIYNGSVRISPLQRDTVGLTAGASYHHMPLGGFTARHLRVDATASAQLGQLGVHGTLAWTRLELGGSPDPTALSPVLSGLVGLDRDDLAASIGDQELDLAGRIDTPRLELAADLALSDHHAIVLQARMALSQDKDLGEQLSYLGGAMPERLGIARGLDPAYQATPEDSYVAGAAWQGSWRNLQVRAGVGVSAAKYAWLLPMTELSWRFGGGSRAVRTEPVALADAGGTDERRGSGASSPAPAVELAPAPVIRPLSSSAPSTARRSTAAASASEAYGETERERQQAAERALDEALRQAGAGSDVLATDHAADGDATD